MIQEYSDYLLTAASLSRQICDAFKDTQFDEKAQAMELFVLQAIATCDSHCRVSALLLQNDLAAEAVATLRPIQELFFDIHWIRQAEGEERLERICKLEADPYARWDKETKRIAAEYSPEEAKKFRGPLDEILKSKPHLTKSNPDGTKHFKSMNTTLPERMGQDLRWRYYHIYMYGSLFVHPTPANRNLYLERRGIKKNIRAIEESLKQFAAYSLLSVKFIIGYAADMLGSLSPAAAKQLVDGFKKMTEIVNKANKGYFALSPKRNKIKR